MRRKPILPFDEEAFSARFHSESDRACAVLGAALLDERLKSLYLRRLQCLKDELLDGIGPISSLSARLQIARALGWVEGDVYDDINIVRRVRNEFAHSIDHDLSFVDELIAVKCKNLRTAQAFIDGHEIAATRPHKYLDSGTIRAMGSAFAPPRTRYETTVGFISQYLNGLSGEDKDYVDRPFLEEIRELGATINIRISIKAAVGPAPPDNP